MWLQWLYKYVGLQVCVDIALHCSSPAAHSRVETVSGQSGARHAKQRQDTVQQFTRGVYVQYMHAHSGLAYPTFSVMIQPQVHLRLPCYDFYFL